MAEFQVLSSKFNDQLLCEGANGGHRAAGALEEYVYNYARNQIEGMPPNVKITARIYANAKGLADTCVRAGITAKASDLQDFMIGFTGAKFLMDFIDVGSGKDRADEKIVGEWPSASLEAFGTGDEVRPWGEFFPNDCRFRDIADMGSRTPQTEPIQSHVPPHYARLLSRQWLCSHFGRDF